MQQFYAITWAGSDSAAPECDCLAHRFGNAGNRLYRRPKYPSDMSDAEWRVARDAMPVPPWLEGRGGQPEGYCHRQMVDAVCFGRTPSTFAGTGFRPSAAASCRQSIAPPPDWERSARISMIRR